MARWVLHVENMNEVDTEALLRRLAGEIAADAKRLAPVRTGRLRNSIHVAEVSDKHAIVQADPRNPDASAGNEPYAGFVERGTSDTPAQPYLRPATYRYRS
jgi:HK97 gp10 family phage protein